MRYFRELKVVRISGFAVVALAAGLAIGAGFGSSASKKPGYFQIIYPSQLKDFKVKPCVAEDPEPCAAESAALAVAISNLEVAQAAAEAAAEAYFECMDANGGGPTPDPNPVPPYTVGLTSILESVK